MFVNDCYWIEGERVVERKMMMGRGKQMWMVMKCWRNKAVQKTIFDVSAAKRDQKSSSRSSCLQLDPTGKKKNMRIDTNSQRLKHLPASDDQSIPLYKSHSIVISGYNLSQYPPAYSSSAHSPSSSPQALSHYLALPGPTPTDQKKQKP
jgi:hypothetical protein